MCIFEHGGTRVAFSTLNNGDCPRFEFHLIFERRPSLAPGTKDAHSLNTKYLLQKNAIIAGLFPANEILYIGKKITIPLL